MNDALPSNPPPAVSRRPYTGWARDRDLFGDTGVGVLMYHKISDPLPGSNWPDLYVTPGNLARHVDDLLAAGLPCLPYDDASETVSRGGRGFCLTFDDGFLSVYENALPILQARGVKAMLFLVAGLIGGTDEWDRAIGEPSHPLMDDAQIREWLAAGHDIGAHTMTHPRLAELPRDRARMEIFDSKARLEDRFGVPVRHFCYPYGSYDETVCAMVDDAGFVDACTASGDSQWMNVPGIDPFLVRRLWACNPA